MPTKTTRPDKKKVREYMEKRAREHTPPPRGEDIRRNLGWALVKDKQKVDDDR